MAQHKSGNTTMGELVAGEEDSSSFPRNEICGHSINRRGELFIQRTPNEHYQTRAQQSSTLRTL